MGAIFRAWGQVSPEKLGDVLNTSAENVRRCAEKMGLDPHLEVKEIWRKRGYITLIRNMWHMLSFDQICRLLDITDSELDTILKEDDFLFSKMGVIVPESEDALWRELTPEEKKTARRIKEVVRSYEDELADYPDRAFDFIRHYYDGKDVPVTVSDKDGDLRLIYSYFALYGDPLIEDECDPFPDKLLSEYAEYGINGIWMQAVLYQLAPYPFKPSLSNGYEKRLENLKRVVKKAEKYGIGIYLYINEPRNMPESFFEDHPQLKGHERTPYRGTAALCTSTPEVREYLESSLYHIFSEVKGLGGILTITASENQTNCYSHSTEADCNCPRCKERSYSDVIAEVNNVMARGVKRANPKARVVAWNWAWERDKIADVISKLSKDIIFQSNSETKMEIVKGGVRNHIDDYSMSNPGPSPLAKESWSIARENALECSAKVQFNSSWEMSGVPFVPAYDLVAEHAANLRREGVRHIMLSWTLGGSPSPNIRLVNDILSRKEPEADEVRAFIRKMYSEEEANYVYEAQRLFSEGFREFPFHIGVLYNAPQTSGPKSPFFVEKTGWNSTMVCFPYDNIDRWRANYPVDVFEEQFRLVCLGNRRALDILDGYLGERSERFKEFYNALKGCYVHFLTNYNLVRFTRRRDEKSMSGFEKEDLDLFFAIFDSEEKNVLDTIRLQSEDSRLGFEASNHYSFTRQDLLEKLVNIDYCRSYYKNIKI